MKNRGDGAIGGEVENDGLRWLPIRRNLQDRRATQTTMGDEHLFAELCAIAGGCDFCRDACKIAVGFAVAIIQLERHEGRSSWLNLYSELASQIVAETGGPGFGDREASGSDHEGRRVELEFVAANHEIAGLFDLANCDSGLDVDAGSAAFGQQHIQNVMRRTIAEQLSQRFLVISDGMLLHQCEEIGRRITGQRRLGKMRIRGEEIFCRAMNVGEVTSAAAGDQNFFSATVRAFQESNATPTFSGFDGAHQAGGTTAENKDVEGFGVQ